MFRYRIMNTATRPNSSYDDWGVHVDVRDGGIDAGYYWEG